MLRRLLIFVILLAAIGLAAFWFVTNPHTVPASALSPRTPDLANGRTMLFAGGRPACHATPDQGHRTRLGGGPALKTPVGTVYGADRPAQPANGTRPRGAR